MYLLIQNMLYKFIDTNQYLTIIVIFNDKSYIRHLKKSMEANCN